MESSGHRKLQSNWVGILSYWEQQGFSTGGVGHSTLEVFWFGFVFLNRNNISLFFSVSIKKVEISLGVF